MSEIKKLSLVIPCFNEEKTLSECVGKVLLIQDDTLRVEIVIVDDCSTDRSLEIARLLEDANPEIKVFQHRKNQGKGAALRTGFKYVTGDYVAVQDADLEYEPNDLKRLIGPLIEEKADVVLGSRFLSTGAHRVFYFWHYMGNRFLTLLSNMLTDLNLTDMETCYKVFKREVIQKIAIKEDRFGFEPEIVAKVAHMRLRIYEMGISYHGRTYAEGKKIGVRDGFRALYCILRYNMYLAPVPLQFLFYCLIGGVACLLNVILCVLFMYGGASLPVVLPVVFLFVAVLMYVFSTKLFFLYQTRWGGLAKNIIIIAILVSVGIWDWWITQTLFNNGMGLVISKTIGITTGFLFNFFGNRFILSPVSPSGPWH